MTAPLRESRTKAYASLWKLLELLAYFERPVPTREHVRKLSSDLTSWYYKTGGIYLSSKARNKYFVVQNTLQRVAKLGNSSSELSRAELDDLQANLRSAVQVIV